MERGVYFKKEIQSNNLFYNESSHLLFGCPTAIFWPLPIRQPHLPDVNHCVYQLFTRWSPGANPLTLTQRLNLLGDSPHHLIASIYLFMNIYISRLVLMVDYGRKWCSFKDLCGPKIDKLGDCLIWCVTLLLQSIYIFKCKVFLAV